MTTAGVPDADALPAPPPSWWTARVGGLPRSFWFLWTGTIVNRAGSFVVPFLALYLTGELATPLGGFLASRDYWLLFALDGTTCAVFAVLILRAGGGGPAGGGGLGLTPGRLTQSARPPAGCAGAGRRRGR